MDGLLEGVESRGAALLNDLNPFGWASKALSLIKEFPVCIKCLFFDYEMCTFQKVGGEFSKGRRVL